MQYLPVALQSHVARLAGLGLPASSREEHDEPEDDCAWRDNKDVAEWSDDVEVRHTVSILRYGSSDKGHVEG